MLCPSFPELPASLEGHFDAPSFTKTGAASFEQNGHHQKIPVEELKTGPTLVVDFGANMNEIVAVHERDMDVSGPCLHSSSYGGGSYIAVLTTARPHTRSSYNQACLMSSSMRNSKRRDSSFLSM